VLLLATVVPAATAQAATVPNASAPGASSGGGGLLTGVACTQPDSCEAVGGYGVGTSNGRPLALEWTGATWNRQRTAPVAEDSGLSQVACPAADDCEAVGTTVGANGSPDQATLAKNWNGFNWIGQPSENPTNVGIAFAGVSCSAAMACEAVGSYLVGTGRADMLAEGWNGTQWTLQTVPMPKANMIVAGLASVSCQAANSCEAVGSYTVGHSTRSNPIAEAWNGTSWTQQAIPTPASSTTTVLDGVSCVAANSCLAVGAYVNHYVLPFAEAWNGSTWAVQIASFTTMGHDDQLTGLSCSGPDFCMAVGTFQDKWKDRLGFAEQWDGNAWNPEATSNPTGATDNTLYGVSCSAADSCEAVGYATLASQAVETQAVVWNGTTWSVQATPNP
jgi:hypothetical protein